MDSGTRELTPTSDGSTMLKFIESGPLEEKGEEEIGAGPILTTPDVDDYPDGGLAAWSIALGVSLSTISSPFEIY